MKYGRIELFEIDRIESSICLEVGKNLLELFAGVQSNWLNLFPLIEFF